jgi:UDP:flavonoid glycosyltransferase YjiC (YdhE family)
MIVLMPNCGYLSETSRMLAIAHALQARGVAVALATHGGPYTRVLDAAGMPWTTLSPTMDDARCAQFLRDLVRIGKPGVRLLSPDEVRASVASEAAFLQQVGATAVVTGFTLTAFLSARVAGIPLVASHGGSFVPPVFERGLLPVPTRMPMPRMEWLPGWLKRKLVNAGPTRLTDPTVFLNTVAAELGVEPVPTLAALMLGDLTLVTDVPEVLGIPAAELEAWRPRRAGLYRADPRLVYTGPLFAQLDLPVPPAVEAFLDGSRPTAYVVLSSSTADQLRAVTSRVRAAGLRVIVGATLHDFGPPPGPDVVVAGLLPSHRVMPRVQVAITMGGQGTVQTAMCSGTPLVGLPLHGEQELNVDLAVRHGMGLAVSPRDADTPRLTQAVQRIVTEPGFAAQARRVQGWTAGTDGAGRAADAIVQFLAKRHPARAEPIAA